MNNILYDIYKRYNAGAWLSPLERAVARLLQVLVVTFLVGALPALSSAIASYNTTGNLNNIDWNGTLNAFIVGGAISVITALWKYGNAQREAATGVGPSPTTIPTNESSKPLDTQLLDALSHALPTVILEILSATQKMPAVTPSQPAVSPQAQANVREILQNTGATVAAPTVPVVEPSADGASDAATPNATAGSGYDGGMGTPAPEDMFVEHEWINDTHIADLPTQEVPVTAPVTAAK